MEEFWNAVITGLASVLLAMAGLAVNRLADWLGLAADDRVRGYLHEALERGIELSVARLRQQQDIGPLPGLAVAGLTAGYLQARVPDALRRFGLSDDALQELILARIVQGYSDQVGGVGASATDGAPAR